MAATKVGILVTTLWLQVPLFFLLQITPVFLAYLGLNRAARWRWPLAAIALSFLSLILISYLSKNPILLSIAVSFLDDTLHLHVPSSVASNLQLMVFGGLIIFFLIVEPYGLARIWQITKEKLRLWPFPH